jgi:hypothetical protein
VPDLAQQQSKVSLPIKNIVDYAIKKECGGYAAARNSLKPAHEAQLRSAQLCLRLVRDSP